MMIEVAFAYILFLVACWEAIIGKKGPDGLRQRNWKDSLGPALGASFFMGIGYVSRDHFSTPNRMHPSDEAMPYHGTYLYVNVQLVRFLQISLSIFVIATMFFWIMSVIEARRSKGQ